MCCFTHDERDRLENPPPELMAENEQWRCRCTFGMPCKRKATAEDLLCGYCRECGHKVCPDEHPAPRVMAPEDAAYGEWISRLNSPGFAAGGPIPGWEG